MRKSFAIIGLAGGLVAALGVGFLPQSQSAAIEPAVVVVPAGHFAYRPAGDFRIGTRSVDAPLPEGSVLPAFAIMAAPVGEAAYAACVADGACRPASGQDSGRASATFAQVDVSFLDATAYAAWLSEETREHWRLPTDAEWQRAAAERAFDSGLGDRANGDDPAQRWLATYRREAETRGDADPVRRPIGGFGTNSLGLIDMAGNVWEWTDTCFVNGQLSVDGQVIMQATDYCGVRVAAGKHRAFIIDFVSDPKTGGCGTGVPPDYLGFRLVRD